MTYNLFLGRSLIVTFLSFQLNTWLESKYLSWAREWIELVQNIRDTNWIKEASSWKSGLSTGMYEADYGDTSLSTWTVGSYLYVEGSTGLYAYLSSPGVNDTKTIYKRKITI